MLHRYVNLSTWVDIVFNACLRHTLKTTLQTLFCVASKMPGRTALIQRLQKVGKLFRYTKRGDSLRRADNTVDKYQRRVLETVLATILAQQGNDRLRRGDTYCLGIFRLMSRRKEGFGVGWCRRRVEI